MMGMLESLGIGGLPGRSQAHLEIKLYERQITHPRFVLRHTISLTAAWCRV